MSYVWRRFIKSEKRTQVRTLEYFLAELGLQISKQKTKMIVDATDATPLLHPWNLLLRDVNVGWSTTLLITLRVTPPI